MGKRGPKKKPTDLKILNGTFRNDRDTEGPKPKPIKPKYPAWLPRKAKLKWNELAPKLENLGLLREIDGEEFARYCLYTVRAREAEEDISKKGLLVPGATPGTMVKNPSVQIARDYSAAASRLADKFGLNPSSRNGLNLNEDNSEDDFMEYLIRGAERKKGGDNFGEK